MVPDFKERESKDDREVFQPKDFEQKKVREKVIEIGLKEGWSKDRTKEELIIAGIKPRGLKGTISRPETDSDRRKKRIEEQKEEERKRGTRHLSDDKKPNK